MFLNTYFLRIYILEDKRILAIVLARAGSKRIKNKNIKELGSKPLIAWTIETAVKSNLFDHVLVSTDSLEIKKISELYGGYAPWLRPHEFATDTSSSMGAILHALSWYIEHYSKPDCVVILQPTSPFRKIETLEKFTNRFFETSAKLMVTVDEVKKHPAWCFRQKPNIIEPLLGWEQMNKRSQDLAKVYVLNGLIFAGTPNEIMNHNGFLSGDTELFITNDVLESIDIDDTDDWDHAVKVLPLI